MELRSSHRDLPYPDRVIVHRKGVPGNEEEEHLAYELRCYPNTAQVCRVSPGPEFPFRTTVMKGSACNWSVHCCLACCNMLGCRAGDQVLCDW